MRIDKSTFKTDKDYFKFVVENKARIIGLKKATTKFTDSDLFNPVLLGNIVKLSTDRQDDDLAAGRIKRTIVGNTYNWMDSHLDVHIKGIFTKSIQENKLSALHLHDHEYKVTAIVGDPADIYEKDILWNDLGINKAGSTVSLLMDSDIKKAYNEMVYMRYLNKQINQHSVGMIYVNLFTCVNDAEYKEEFANWSKYFPLLGNPEKALEEGVFWAVTEAKLKEISCVIAGSNELTPTLEPSKITPNKSEPVKPTLFDFEQLNKHLTPFKQLK